LNENESDVSYQVTLNDKSLVKIHSNNYYCPTCQKIIEEGYGFYDSDRIITDGIVSAQNSKLSLRQSVELLKPLLEFFQEGLYILTRVKMFPVDGESNFFWTSTKKGRNYIGTADIYYNFHYSNGFPSFLYPSQPLSKFDENILNNYRNNISLGENMTGLAIYLDGFMSLLIDGHHRAAAACLEEINIDCLTLIRVNGYQLCKDDIQMEQ